MSRNPPVHLTTRAEPFPVEANKQQAADIEAAYAKYPGVKVFINELLAQLIEAREQVQRLRESKKVKVAAKPFISKVVEIKAADYGWCIICALSGSVPVKAIGYFDGDALCKNCSVEVTKVVDNG